MDKTSNKIFDEAEIELLSNGHQSNPSNTPKNDSCERYSVSDRRRALSQYCASCALSLLTVCFGTSFGFSTMLISELENLRQADKDFITLDQLTWLSSVNYFAIPIGAAFSGLISQRWGRRNSLILSTFPYIASWILLYMCGPRQLWPIFSGLLLLGCSGGIIESPLQIYVTEVSEPRLRGSISASVGATIMLGVFLQMVLGKYLDWQSLALANISFPLLALLALNFVPESPYWLASKGRYEESLKALAWLRGWCRISHLPQDEFQDIISTVSKETNNKPRSIKRYFARSTMMPFALVSFVFLVSCFNGTVSVLSWALPLFKQINSPIEQHVAAIILGAVQLIATIVVMITLPYIGRRKSTFASLAATGLALFVAAGYMFVAQVQRTTHSSWVPTLAVFMAIGFSFLGIKHVPWILTGELFSTDVRSQMAGILAGNCQIFSAIASKTYYYTVEKLTLPGTFLLFACVNFFGFFVLYYIMPETEGKSLADIERYFINGKTERKKSLSKVSVRDL